MDTDNEPCDVEEAYLRIYSSRTRKKEMYFPQFFQTDFNGDSNLQLPQEGKLLKFQEPELHSATGTGWQPNAWTPSGSRSQMNLNNTLGFNGWTENDLINANRPTTVPEEPRVGSSKSKTRVKVLSRTVTRILVPRTNPNRNMKIIDPTFENPNTTYGYDASTMDYQSIDPTLENPNANYNPTTMEYQTNDPNFDTNYNSSAMGYQDFHHTHSNALHYQQPFPDGQHYHQPNPNGFDEQNSDGFVGQNSDGFGQNSNGFVEQNSNGFVEQNSNGLHYKEENTNGSDIHDHDQNQYNYGVQEQTPDTSAESYLSSPGTSSKKSVIFKANLLEDSPSRSASPTLQGQNGNSPGKGVLKTKQNDDHESGKEIANNANPPTSTPRGISRIPIPVFRTQASIAISGQEKLSKSTASKNVTNKVRKTVVKSPQNPSTAQEKKMAISKKPTRATNKSPPIDPLQKKSDEEFNTSDEMVSSGSSTNISREDSVEFYEAEDTEVSYPLKGQGSCGLKGVLDETIPQLYDSNTSINSEGNEDSSNSQSESSTTNVCEEHGIKSENQNIPGNEDHQHEPENSNEFTETDDTIETWKNHEISNSDDNDECLNADETLVSKSQDSFQLNVKEFEMIYCRYKTAGCLEELPGGTSTEERHYQKCRYRPIPCLFSRICNEIVPYHNFILHHNSHHLTPSYTSTLLTPVYLRAEDFLEGQTWNPKWLSTYNNHFFIMLNHSQGQGTVTGTWLCWLWMLGTPEEAGDYFYNVEVCCGPRKISGTFTAQSVRTSAEEIQKAHSGLIFTDTVAKQITGMTRNVIGQFFIDVTILKKPLSHQAEPSYSGPYAVSKKESLPLIQ